ncbi:hypothetical protein MMC28_010781 [Mycoblastus sanguinarius]|nr:hypothetical protein [Mycoblastus sanguinarius]
MASPKSPQKDGFRMSSPRISITDPHDRPLSPSRSMSLNRPISAARSAKTPITDDNDRPISILSVTSNSPQITTAPLTPRGSLTTEILSPNPNHTIDRFDVPTSDEEDEDGQEISRIGSVSTSAEQSNDSAFGRKTAPAQHRGHSILPSNLRIGLPIGLSSSLGFAIRTSDTSSTKGTNSPRGSRVESSGSDGTRSHRFSTLEVADGASPPPVSSQVVGQAVSADSPFTLAERTLHLRSEESPGPLSADSMIAIKSPASAVDSLATVSTSKRAEKSPRGPFLPKFFKLASPGLGKGQANRDSADAPKGKGIPGSFFEEESSDEEGGDVEIKNAEQAFVGTPVMIRHSSSPKVELKEMLRSTPPAEDNPGPSRRKALNVLGEDVDLKRQSRRSGVVGMPEPEQEDDNAAAADGQSGALGNWNSFSDPFAAKGLRKHREESREESPGTLPTKRKVSFPRPPRLEVKPEHRFLRQDIVSTPYPLSGNKEDSTITASKPGTVRTSMSGTALTGDKGPESVLTLVLYSHGNPIPKIKKITIPGPQEITFVDDSEDKKPPIRATMRTEFDDEKLFKLLRSEYTSMRGSLLNLLSARNIRSINLLSYRSTHQLATSHATHMHFRVNEIDGEFAEARMLTLFQKPHLGRKHNQWVEWVSTLPENSGEHASDKDRIAVEIVEGWCVAKLACAVAAVLVCSLAAMLLWIFLGLGGGELEAASSGNNFVGGSGLVHGESTVGFRGAGGRVGAGVALGLLVLGLGWTVVAGWALLSWLVM